MRKLVTLSLLVFCLALGAAAAQADDAGDRKEKILANLKARFPQLQQASVTINDLEPSPYGSLDQGSFTINNQQTQKFLVSSDDKALYMVSEPIDVSKNAEEIQAELAKQEADKAAEAAERNKELMALTAGQPFRGNPDAPVTIVEYSDFQCPYCARGAKTVEEILEKYPQDVKIVFQHFPLNFHPWAKPAAIAADCAAKQDQEAFWKLHDKYFEDQKALNPGNVLAKSKEYLADSGLDMAKWSACAEDKDSAEYKEMAAAVDAEMATGQKFGVSGTPGFFVNGHFLNGAQPLAAFEPLIDAAKKDAGS